MTQHRKKRWWLDVTVRLPLLLLLFAAGIFALPHGPEQKHANPKREEDLMLITIQQYDVKLEVAFTGGEVDTSVLSFRSGEEPRLKATQWCLDNGIPDVDSCADMIVAKAAEEKQKSNQRTLEFLDKMSDWQQHQGANDLLGAADTRSPSKLSPIVLERPQPGELAVGDRPFSRVRWEPAICTPPPPPPPPVPGVNRSLANPAPKARAERRRRTVLLPKRRSAHAKPLWRRFKPREKKKAVTTPVSKTPR